MATVWSARADSLARRAALSFKPFGARGERDL
jgi:hypothetical protein